MARPRREALKPRVEATRATAKATGSAARDARPATFDDQWRARLVVVLVALGASLAGIVNDFTLDDVALVQSNARMHSLGHWLDILSSPYWPPPFQQDLYRPVASLLLAVEYALGGGGPMLFRLVSCALYVAVALGVFSLASRLFSRRVALAVAALFAAHPVHVEAVALAVNQGELIVALLGIIMVCRYLDARRRGMPTRADWTVLTLLYSVASLTKENGFVLPGLLVATELLLLEGPSLRVRAVALWRGYGAMACAGVALLAIRAAVLHGNVVGAFTSEALVGLGVGGRILTMLKVVPVWLRLLAWPAHLQVDYGPNEIVASTAFGKSEAIGLSLVLATVALAVAARRRAPGASFGVAWFAVAILPVSNILVATSIVVAERTLFLPSIGFLFAVAALATAVATALARTLARTPARWTALREVIVLTCMLLVCAGLLRSTARQRVWLNNARLGRASAIDAPRSLRVQQAHADAVAGLVKDFNARIAASAAPWRERYLMATLLRAMGEDTAAVTQLRRSLVEQPGQADVVAALARAIADSAAAARAAGPP